MGNTISFPDEPSDGKGSFLIQAGTSITPSFGRLPPLGAALIAFVAAGGGNSASLITGPATWARSVGVGNGQADPESLRMAFFARPNCDGTEIYPTFTASGAQFMFAQIIEASGIASGGPTRNRLNIFDVTGNSSQLGSDFIQTVSTGNLVGPSTGIMGYAPQEVLGGAIWRINPPRNFVASFASLGQPIPLQGSSAGNVLPYLAAWGTFQQIDADVCEIEFELAPNDAAIVRSLLLVNSCKSIIITQSKAVRAPRAPRPRSRIFIAPVAGIFPSEVVVRPRIIRLVHASKVIVAPDTPTRPSISPREAVQKGALKPRRSTANVAGATPTVASRNRTAIQKRKVKPLRPKPLAIVATTNAMVPARTAQRAIRKKGITLRRSKAQVAGATPTVASRNRTAIQKRKVKSIRPFPRATVMPPTGLPVASTSNAAEQKPRLRRAQSRANVRPITPVVRATSNVAKQKRKVEPLAPLSRVADQKYGQTPTPLRAVGVQKRKVKAPPPQFDAIGVPPPPPGVPATGSVGAQKRRLKPLKTQSVTNPVVAVAPLSQKTRLKPSQRPQKARSAAFPFIPITEGCLEISEYPVALINATDMPLEGLAIAELQNDTLATAEAMLESLGIADGLLDQLAATDALLDVLAISETPLTLAVTEALATSLLTADLNTSANTLEDEPVFTLAIAEELVTSLAISEDVCP